MYVSLVSTSSVLREQTDRPGIRLVGLCPLRPYTHIFVVLDRRGLNQREVFRVSDA